MSLMKAVASWKSIPSSICVPVWLDAEILQEGVFDHVKPIGCI